MTLQTTIDTEQIKLAADLRDHAATFTTLRSESSTEMSGPCPKCGGDDRFHCKKEIFMCRECHPKWADVIEFYVWKDGISFKEACARASNGASPTTSTPVQPIRAERKPKEWDEATYLQQAKTAHNSLISGTGKYSQAARDYLSGRGLTLETMDAFKFGFCQAGLPYTWDKDKEARTYPKQSAVLIPWFDRSRSLVGIRYRFLENHEYTNIKGEICNKNKNSQYGSDLTGVFGWQAIKGPDRCDVLIITEGEMNVPSLWQAGAGLVDVLSSGSESTMKTLPSDVIAFARQYKHLIVWADKGSIAESTAVDIGAHAMRSPGGQDANDLLMAGKLDKLLVAMIKRIATIQPIEEKSDPILHTGLTWPDAKRIQAELVAQRGNTHLRHGIGGNAKTGFYVAERDYGRSTNGT